MTKRMLIAFAHPDDESFGLGGLIARYVAEGVEVYLICATNGDAGTVAADKLRGYNSITELRLAELDCAANLLGLRRVFNFGYSDSGMMNSVHNDNPDCLWHVWQQRPEEVTRRVVDVIRAVRPQVVVTFNEYGGYGHPDHIAIHRATVAAFDLAGDPNFITEDCPPYSPQKLYYTSIPAMMIKIGVWLMRLRGKDPRRAGVNQDVDVQAILDHISPVHARVNIRGYLDQWEAASACHDSQNSGSIAPRWLRKVMTASQGLTRAYPRPVYDRVDEHDLFNGVQTDR